MKTWILSLLVFATLLTACNGMPTPAPVTAAVDESTPTVTAEGKLIPSPAAELSFVQAGVVGEMMVKNGDRVAAGDVLARLVGFETTQAELAAAELEHTLAQQSLDAMERNAMQASAEVHQALLDTQKAYENEARGWHLNRDHASELERALDRYIEAEEDYRSAKTELDRQSDKDRSHAKRQDAQQTFDEEKGDLAARYADLMEEIPTADERIDAKQAALLRTIAALELARQQVDRLEKGIDREQLAAADARLKAAEAHRAAASAALAFYELRAPFAGTILSVRDLSIGEAARPGEPVIFLADITHWIVETKDLAEIDVAQVAPGQSAAVKLDAFQSETFNGTVTEINPVGREYLGDMTYQMKITLAEPDPRFLWNMTANVTIETE